MTTRHVVAAITLLVLTACGAASAVDPKPDATDPEHVAAQPATPDASTVTPDRVTPPTVDAQAPVPDTGVDAPTVPQDAGADAPLPVDAAPDADPMPDAAADAAPEADAAESPPPPPPPPPPPVCVEGASRCDSYQQQVCLAETWTWQVGPQSCCHDPRFTFAGSQVTDSTTGLVWYRYGGQGNGSGCAAVGARLPTTAELLAITIGAPVNNVSVCAPMVDQLAFQGVQAGKTVTADGCVDLTTGTSSVGCGKGTPGFMCVLQ